MVPIGRRAVSENAGLSHGQQKIALGIAAAPTEDFEKTVESDNPPSIKEAAAKGRKPRKQSSSETTEVDRFVKKFAKLVDVAAGVVEGMSPEQREEITFLAKRILDMTEPAPVPTTTKRAHIVPRTNPPSHATPH